MNCIFYSIYSNKIVTTALNDYVDAPLDMKVVFWTFCHHPDAKDFYKTYHDRVVDLNGAFFHLSTHFVRPLLNSEAAFALFTNRKGRVIETTGRCYVDVALDLERAQRLLDNEECENIRPVLEDLRTFCALPSFARGIDAQAIHFMLTAAFSHRRFVLTASSSLKKSQEATDLISKNRSILSQLLLVLGLIENCSVNIQKEESLLAIKKQEIDFNTFIQKVKRLAVSLEGQAFLYRWIRFQPDNPRFPIHTTLSQTQVADFKKKYLSHPNPEIRSIARQCLKLFKFQQLMLALDENIATILTAMATLARHEKQFSALAVQMQFTEFPRFLDSLETYIASQQALDGKFNAPDLRKALERVRPFAPSLHLLYRVYYTVTEELREFQNKKVRAELCNSLNPSHTLPSPDHVETFIAQMGVSAEPLREELDTIEEETASPKSAAGAGMDAKKPPQKTQGDGMPAAAAARPIPEVPADARPAAAAAGVHVVAVADEGKGSFTPVVAKKIVDPLKHIPLARDFPLKPLAYDARVRAHFLQLAALEKGYSAASREIQVHAFSPLVDRYVGTVYGLPDKWTNTHTGKQDTRYRLPAQITLTGQAPRAVIFRYTQGADGVWYHRDMTYQDENHMWYAVDFPKLGNVQKGKTWTLTHDKGTETYDPVTGTITIEAEGHTIVLFPVRGEPLIYN